MKQSHKSSQFYSVRRASRYLKNTIGREEMTAFQMMRAVKMV
jgi:hypothetical protein